jgi:mRNA-degrading endonuclease RelE of RelBE toxin-antitoxin system
MKVRIEIHLESKEVKLLDRLAKEEGRSRKNFCETEIRKLIEPYYSKLKTGSNNANVQRNLLNV